MNTKGNAVKRILSIVICAALITAAVPTGVLSALGSAKKAPLPVTVVSDIHYYPDTLKGKGENGKGFSEAWTKFSSEGSKQIDQLDGLLDAVFAKAVKEKSKYLLIPGDLTKDGEYEAHRVLAKKLEKFEKDTGIDVIVINGNHDINNSHAVTYENNKKEPAKTTSPEEFRELYKNLGYDLACDTYTPSKGKAGMLSYAVELEGGYRLIAIDSCRYSADIASKGTDEHDTAGGITDELMQWVKDQCGEAKKKGQEIVGLIHHNTVPHMTVEEEIFQAFVLEDWMQATEALADAGMHFTFSGHLHTPDIASHTNDNGETLWDIETPSISSFPNKFRSVVLDNTGDNFTVKVRTHDVDEDAPIKANGVTYEQPYKYTYSFFKTYGPNDLHTFIMTMIKGALGDIFADISAQGGLYKYLVASGIDLEKIIIDALGTNGLEIGSVEILTVSSNIMSFIKDLCAQVDEAYINNPERVYDIISDIVTKILNFPVSDYKCTEFYKTMGMESKNEKGTFEDMAYSVMLTMYNGDEDMSNDKFMNDTLDYLKNRGGAEDLINLLLDIVIEDVLEDEILSTLDFRPGQLFPAGTVTSPIGVMTTIFMEILFAGDTSYENVIYSILNLLPEKYSSIRNILDTVLIDEYMTDSQYESLGYTMDRMIRSFAEDFSPAEKSDLNIDLIYTGKVAPEVTVENYRLPSNISVTFGDRATSQRNINWYTKYSVKGTDIQIAPYSDSPKFDNTLPKGVKVEKNTETVSRHYPGVDLGIIGFMPKSFDMVRHEVKITGLKSGTKYSYRVGDAARGWWSEAGIIETADNSDSFTFFHVSDEQSQNAEQYKKWGQVVDTAMKLFPQGKFFVSAGDQVDYTEHFTQWSWLFNASKNLKNTVLMPAAGNHEKKGYMLDQNFILPTTVEQDRESGVYYSFDYNNTHFMVLNTNDLGEDNALSEAQVNWLKEDAAAHDAQWKIVVMHKALYSNGSHYDDKDVKAMRTQLGTLMPDLGIDLVLQGHDHVYLRTDVMDENKVVKAEEEKVTFGGREYTMKLDPSGSIYVISACAGVKQYITKDVKDTDKLFPRAESIYDATDAMFSAITIDGNKLYFDAYMLDSTAEGGAKRVDSFALSKEKKDYQIDEPIVPEDGGSEETPAKPDSKPVAPDTGAAASMSLVTLAGAAFVIAYSARRKKEN